MIFTRRLSGGTVVAGEVMSDSRAVAVGCWVRAGSVNESAAESGVSHFLEHMNFKGTDTRTAREIAVRMDSVGGVLNAFTTKECTCYYVKVAREHLDLALDILTDIVYRSGLNEELLNREKTVVLDEIAQVEDDPEDRVQELLHDCCWDGHPLARPVLGSADVIRTMTHDFMAGYRARWYADGNIVFSAAGSFDPDALCARLEREQGRFAGQTAQEPAPAAFLRRTRYQSKAVEQVHIAMAYPGLPRDHEQTYSLHVLNTLLGGGMSSRLFQSLREEGGLVYSIFTYPEAYGAQGLLVVDTAAVARRGGQVLSQIRGEIDGLLHGGITQEEFLRAREQLKGNFILEREGIESHMSALGRGMLFYGRIRSEEEILGRIEAVTPEGVQDVAQKVLGSTAPAVAIIGPGSERREIEKQLKGWT